MKEITDALDFRYFKSQLVAKGISHGLARSIGWAAGIMSVLQ